MAEDIKKTMDIRSQDYRYKSRAPYYNQVWHLNDNFKNLGYDYRGQLYKKTTSPELWGNPIQIPFIGRLEAIVTLLVEHTKIIKKWFSPAHEKETLHIN